ncbi:MAG: hypothetical protein WBP29_04235 [Candidatus Zixiibacteriota bacterium]
MNSRLFNAVAFSFPFTLLLFAHVIAATPERISYQGRLTDGDGAMGDGRRRAQQ